MVQRKQILDVMAQGIDRKLEPASWNQAWYVKSGAGKVSVTLELMEEDRVRH